MLVIDGSQGEGGGQILRSSLSLSVLTQTPFRIENIRAGRRRPGLLRQHLTAVRAAADVSRAEVDGDSIGSGELTFKPSEARAGEYSFSVRSAGSTSLVFQTLLPALALADGPSTVEVRGGTHNPSAPPFDFLVRTLFPLLGRMGVSVEGTLHRPGYYPAGGGHATYRVQPTARLEPLTLLSRGEIRRRAITAQVADLPPEIGEREIDTIAMALGWDQAHGRVHRVKNSTGPGNVVTVEIESDEVTEIFSGFGEKGVSAQAIGTAVAQEVASYLAAGVPVGQHLADQLLLWLALAGRGSFRTVAPTQHTLTHCDVIRTFLDVRTDVTDVDGAWVVRVSTS